MVDDIFKNQVKKGFQSCKEDVEAVRFENDQLKNKVENLEGQVSTLVSEIRELTSVLSSMKENLSKPQVVQREEIVEPLYTSEVVREVPIQTRKVPIEDPYEALLAFKAKANKKDLVKKKMASLIGENGLSLAELKYMIVDHFRYCSKATFYNYLKELEYNKVLNVERRDSKNMVFLMGIDREI